MIEEQKIAFAPLESRDPDSPLSAQQIFIAYSLNDENLVDTILLEGGRGTGKTKIAIFAFLIHVHKGYKERWRGLVIRTLLDTLRLTFEDALTIVEDYWTEGKDYKVDRTSLTITWFTGEQLIFMQCKDEKDFEEKFKGHEYQFILFEELTTFISLAVFDLMYTCLRCKTIPGEKTPPLMMRATTNPDGTVVCRKQVKERFILAGDPGVVIIQEDDHPYEPDVKVVTKQLTIKTTLKENYRVDDNYVKKIMMLKKTNFNKYLQHMFGDWSDFDDEAIFASVYDPTKLFIKPFKVPRFVQTKRAFDWGSDDPFAYLLFFKHNGEPFKLDDGKYMNPPPGTIFVVKEVYGAASLAKPNKGLQMTPVQVAKHLRTVENNFMELHMEKPEVHPGPADDIIMRGEKMGQRTFYEDFKDQQLYHTRGYKAKDSIESGVIKLREYMYNTINKIEDQPHIYFFNTCVALKETVFSIRGIDGQIDRPAPKQPDHILDLLRYIVLELERQSSVEYL